MSVKIILSGAKSALHRLHIDAHRSMIAALAIVLALAGLVAPKYGKSQKKPKQKAVPTSGAGFKSRADSQISTGAGIQLKLTKFEKHYDGKNYSWIQTCPNTGGIPDNVSASNTSSFCYGSYSGSAGVFEVDTGFYFYYDILIPNGTGGWMPSGYYVDGAAKVPMCCEADRKLDCAIKKSGSTNRADGAAFRCDVSWTGSGNSSEPHWKVTTNEVTVIDAANSANVERAAELIGAYCKESDTPRCSWTRTKKSTAFVASRDDWVPLTHWADSCPPTDPNKLFELTATRNVAISWSDKVGGKIIAKASGKFVFAQVEASIEANYEHSITQTNSFGEGYKYTIPYKHQAALFVVYGMLEVSGDFTIATETGQRYLIKNAVFRFPLSKDVKVEGRGQPIQFARVRHADLPCDDDEPAPGAPPPAKAKTGLLTLKTP